MKRIALLILLCTCTAFADVPDGLTRFTNILICDPEDTPDVTPGKDDAYIKGTLEVDGSTRLDDDVDINADLDVSGSVTFPGGTDITLDDVAANDGSTDEEITLNSGGITDLPLTVKGASGQTAALVKVTDSNDVSLFQVTANGAMHNVEGIRTVTTEYGAGLGIHLYGDDTPEHVNQSGWYDYTGGVQEQLFTKTSGDDFTQADADTGNFILLTNVPGKFPMAEIKTYLSATTVIVDGFGWDGDIGSGGSPHTFLTIKHPSFISGDGNQHEFSVGSTGEFEIAGYSFTGHKVAEIEVDAAADTVGALKIDMGANGYNTCLALEVVFSTGDISPGESTAGIFSFANMAAAINADETSTVPCYVAGVSGTSDAESKGYLALAGLNTAFQVYGDTVDEIGYGYELSSGGTVATSRTTEFNTAGNDVAVFDADNDWILIGSDSTFEIVNIALATAASRNMRFEFYYSKAGGNWTALVVTDSTNGFRDNAGTWIFTAPGDWTKDDETPDGDAITEAYYIGVKRTRNATPAQLPVESFFGTVASRSVGMKIKGTGIVQLPYGSAPSAPANGDIWMESDGLHLYYNGGERIVSDGAP